MATIFEIVSGNPKSGELVLSENGNSGVDKGGPVEWKIKNGSNVSEITDISMKPTPDSTDIFSSKPAPNGSSKKWKGIVSKDAKTDDEYIYNIFWKDAGGGPYKYDPILRVNP